MKLDGDNYFLGFTLAVFVLGYYRSSKSPSKSFAQAGHTPKSFSLCDTLRRPYRKPLIKVTAASAAIANEPTTQFHVSPVGQIILTGL